MADEKFSDIRIEYGDEPLRRADLPVDPVQLFRDWLDQAVQAAVSEPNGMAVATCDADGQPHCRILLLKQVDEQVRITGSIEQVPASESDAYFRSRPRRAQLCSAASPQSRVVANREQLEQFVDALEQRIGDGEVERPEHWGGYVLKPLAIEFWQGRDGRLHDRFRFTRAGDAWRIDRLAS